MGVKYELMVPIGKYQVSGQDKTQWMKIGNIFEKNGKFSMRLNAIPTTVVNLDGEDIAFDGWVKMFKPKPRDGAPAPSQAPPPPAEMPDDDVPF